MRSINEPRKLSFKFDNPITLTAHAGNQVTDLGKAYRLEIETPDGPVHFTYEEWVRFAQTVAVLLRPRLLLED